MSNIFIPSLNEQRAARREAIQNLYHFMVNPGRFSILLLGAHGTGKTHWIKEVYNAVAESSSRPDHWGGLSIHNAIDFPQDRAGISRIFSEADGKLLVIENIELLEKPKQQLLQAALSTTEGGKMGLDDEKVQIRTVFTSSIPIEQLKENENYLLHAFWDRVSQLVVELPSFSTESENILRDFRATWAKMSFQSLEKTPDLGELEEWLEKEGRNFRGNFRDLDKICILWHQYRLIQYGQTKKIEVPKEAKVLESVRGNFERFARFPEVSTDDSTIFVFERGFTKEKLEREFRSKFKKWALKEYGTMQKASKELGMSHRTMDNW